MKRLLSIELQKLWLNRASRVLIISYFGILSLIALIANIEFDIMGVHISMADQGIFNFPFIWHFNSYVAVYFKGFLAIIIVSMMANEYSYGTLKQNLIDGLSKKEFIASKVVTIAFFAFASTAFVYIMTLILGLRFSSYTEAAIIFRDQRYIIAYLINLMAFFSFCLFAGILVKRSAFALGFTIVWYLLEGLLYGLMRWKLFNKEIADSIKQFFPLSAISDLLINPSERFKAVRAIQTNIGVTSQVDYSLHWTNIAIVAVWSGLFIYASYFILKKRDL
ncbi:ABC transporter permease subunit [Flavobacterium sp. RNTU_13]|uniref:ABC transporter permease subunit n=1 Tax=Flavobacterium sp. RNTU_13 TaxID=3375145 RepID=UPI003986CE53